MMNDWGDAMPEEGELILYPFLWVKLFTFFHRLCLDCSFCVRDDGRSCCLLYSISCLVVFWVYFQEML